VSERTCIEFRDDMIALTEGALEPRAERALLSHLENCAACRQEYKWYRIASTGLTALGAEQAAKTPPVDLVAGVIEAVANLKAAEPRVISFDEQARARRRPPLLWFGAVAAAAAVLLFLWGSGFRVIREPMQPSATQITQQTPKPVPHPPAHKTKPAKTPANRGSDEAKLKDLQRQLQHLAPQKPGEAGEGEGEGGLDVAEDVTLENVLAARRAAITDPKSLAQLTEWATLSEAKARELVQAKDVSLDAKVGAAGNLPSAEAERILLAAVKKSPDSPYLHDALAKAYAADPAKSAEAASQLQDVSSLDPNNALAQYKLAANLLGQGDIQGGTAALDRARSLEQASPYTQDADAYREQALTASGVTPSAARALTALTSGTTQYPDLVGLGAQLLQYGKDSEQSGNLDLARQIYDSVLTFGRQVSAGTNQSAERLAGLDIQSAAVDSLAQLFTFLGAKPELDALTSQTQDLVTAYSAIVQFFQSLDGFFAQLPQELIQMVADFILQFGDLGLLDQFPSAAQSQSSSTP
jgi:tetratricopeptide (TPR) repeat protein